MTFNSLDFGVFFTIVFFVYWFILSNNLKLQNTFILIASYIFYGWWDWRYLILLSGTSLIDYISGIKIEESNNPIKRKKYLFLSLFANLSILGIFKYYNFFIESFITAFSFTGIELNITTLNIILPIGISFYTFQELTYTIDIYYKRMKPTKDIINFFTFVSFFPPLISGPIERAKHLLPQIEKKRVFDYKFAKDGLRLILWGLFMKVVIADSLAIDVEMIFSNYSNLRASTLLLGNIYFVGQLYCDFAGYSYIAIGLAKLLGIHLSKNFNYPFLATNISELWRRWHITFMNFLRFYIAIPLIKVQKNRWRKIIAINVIFLISGLWHGAKWTFVIWGILNGIYMSIYMLIEKKGREKSKSKLVILSKMIGTTLLLAITCTFFRAESVSQAFSYLGKMLSLSILSKPEQSKDFLWIILLISWEWMQKDKEHGLDLDNLNTFVRWLIYAILIILVLKFVGYRQQYIYFKF